MNPLVSNKFNVKIPISTLESVSEETSQNNRISEAAVKVKEGSRYWTSAERAQIKLLCKKLTTEEVAKIKKRKEIAKLPDFMETILKNLDPKKYQAVIDGFTTVKESEEWIDFSKDLLIEYTAKGSLVEQIILIALSEVEVNLETAKLIGKIRLPFFEKLPEYVQIRKDWLKATCKRSEELNNEEIFEIQDKAKKANCPSLLASLNLEEDERHYKVANTLSTN